MKKKLILIPLLILVLVATLAIGCAGEEGLKGAKGGIGDQGIQGIQGEHGEHGFQGLQGEQGEVGLQGEYGARGATGAKGATGSVGATGEQGIQGEQGLRGYTGATGATGAQGETAPYIEVTLETKRGGETAEFVLNNANSGALSVHLDTNGVATGGEGRIVIQSPLGMTLSQIDSVSWFEFNVAGYPPHLDIILDIDGDSVADDALVFEYAYNDMSHYTGEAPMPFGALTGAWYQVFGDDGNGPVAIDDSAGAWLTSQASGPPGGANFYFGTLADWKAGNVDTTAVGYSINGDTTVLRLEIEIDNWVVECESYIDDVALNGTTLYWLP